LNILLIILIVIIVLIGWLLLAPIQIIIKSEEHLLKFSVVSIGYATIVLEDDDFTLSFRIAFFSRRLSLNELWKKRKLQGDHKEGDKNEFEEDLKRKKKKTRTISKKKRKWLLRLFRIPKSFKVRELFVNVDTGDYILNAYLFPVFGLLNYYRPEWSCSVNYYGRNQVSLFLQSSLLRMIYVFLK
jgi:hypothetical protein